jgi:hypothetical protein
MSLETKGTIKYDPDVKPNVPEYTIAVKQLGITAEGSGNIVQMMDELTERVRREMADQFGVAGCDVEMVKYSITCTFDVSAPVNRTLEEFSVAPSKNDDTAITVQFGDHPPMVVNQEHLVLAKKTLELSKQTGLPPETIIAAAKTKMKAGKGAGK